MTETWETIAERIDDLVRNTSDVVNTIEDDDYFGSDPGGAVTSELWTAFDHLQFALSYAEDMIRASGEREEREQ